jgi:acyl carrier protein
VSRRDSRKQLAAYIVPEAGNTPDENELRVHLRRALPEHMIPTTIVFVGKLPLTPNGKLDRTALQMPDIQVSTSGRAPRDERERILCELFATVLELPAVTIDDDFLRLGGDSLLAMRLVSRIRAALSVELSAKTVFEAPTVVSLAERLGTVQDGRPVLRQQPRSALMPLSPAQARLWFLDLLEGPSAAYNTPVHLRMRGRLADEALELALNDVIVRHEILRTRYVEHRGTGYQEIIPPESARLPLSRSQSNEQELAGLLEKLARLTFDLAAGPPLRATLIRLGPEDHVLALSMHHILYDGWSAQPLFQDLAHAYNSRLRGAVPAWTPPPVQYADYALWQNELLGTTHQGPLAAQRAYWRSQLNSLPVEIRLPVDRRRPPSLDHSGGTIVFEIPTDLHARLLDLASRSCSTLFMVLQTALAATLSSLGAGTDIPIGSAIAGRTDHQLDDLVGFFVNTVVLRHDLTGSPTLIELLDRTRATALAAYANQDMPFEHVVQLLNPARIPGRHPLFQTMLTLHNTRAVRHSEFAGLSTRQYVVERSAAKFDLDLQFTESAAPYGGAAGIVGRLEFSTALFDQSTTESISRRLVAVIRAMAEKPYHTLASLNAELRAAVGADGAAEI